MEIKEILVPIDFSECTKPTMEYALLFQQRYGARLVLLHVLSKAFEVYATETSPAEGLFMHSGDVLIYRGTGGQEVRRDFGMETQWKLKDLVPVSLHDQVQTEVRVGDPSVEIVRLAYELRVDMIIMGTHGRTGLSHLVMGSVAERVVRYSPVPVLTVRPASQPCA